MQNKEIFAATHTYQVNDSALIHAIKLLREQVSGDLIRFCKRMHWRRFKMHIGNQMSVQFIESLSLLGKDHIMKQNHSQAKDS